MSNEFILEGLKNALNKGQSLKDAMMSFYNAGYKKEEIEKAARQLHMHSEVHPVNQIPHKEPVQEIPKKEFKKLPSSETPDSIMKKHGHLPSLDKKPKKSLLKPSNIRTFSKQESHYGSEEIDPIKKLKVILFVLILLCLAGIVTSIFFFKEELSYLYNSLFG